MKTNYLSEFKKSVTEMSDIELDSLLSGVRTERLQASRIVKSGKRSTTPKIKAVLESKVNADLILQMIKEKGIMK